MKRKLKPFLDALEPDVSEVMITDINGNLFETNALSEEILDDLDVVFVAVDIFEQDGRELRNITVAVNYEI